MQYMILTYESPSDFEAREGPRSAEYWGSWRDYTRALSQAGILRGGNALKTPDAATTVRREGDGRRVQDGPFADSKEQLGGYYVIEVDDLDQALEWAARCPCASTGQVEVRPVLEMS